VRVLTPEEQIALTPLGPPGQILHESVFEELVRLGWGRWVPDPCRPYERAWEPTPSGLLAAKLDALARECDPL
jgi:hypothetical protein